MRKKKRIKEERNPNDFNCPKGYKVEYDNKRNLVKRKVKFNLDVIDRTPN